MSDSYIEHIDKRIVNMSDIDKHELVKRIVNRVSYYDEPFDKMLHIMLLFYDNVLEFESGEYKALFDERLNQAMDEFFTTNVEIKNTTK